MFNSIAHDCALRHALSCSCDTMMVDTTLEEAPPLLMLALCRDAERENARAGSKLAVSKAVKINKEVELSLHSAGKVSTFLNIEIGILASPSPSPYFTVEDIEVYTRVHNPPSG